MQSIINTSSLSQNLSGIKELNFIPVTTPGLTELPRINQTALDKVIDPDKFRYPAGGSTRISWYYSKFIREEASWTTDEDDTNQGNIYKEKITWFVAHNYDFRKAGFDDMEGREFLVLVTDNNNNKRLLGYVTFDGIIRGMRFSKKRTTGGKHNERNFYTLEFYMEAPVQPWVINPTATILSIDGF